MIREVFGPARKRAKLAPMRFHDLRHSYASVLIEQGAHPKVISDQLGHASVQITIYCYSHLFDGAYADVNDELEQAWRAVETASGPASAEGATGAGSVPPRRTPSGRNRCKHGGLAAGGGTGRGLEAWLLTGGLLVRVQPGELEGSPAVAGLFLF